MKINYKNKNKEYEDKVTKYRNETNFEKNKYITEFKEIGDSEKPFTGEYYEVKEDNLGYKDKPITLENKEYIFVDFKKTKIGKSVAISEDEMLVVSANFFYVNFTDCIFENVKFKDCTFIGCKFKNCETEDVNVIFEECFFSRTVPYINEKGKFEFHSVSTEFVDCWIASIKFRKCSLDNVIWQDCKFSVTSFNQCTVKESIFLGCRFGSVVFNDSDISGIGILKIKNADLEFYGEYQDSEFYKSVYIDLMDCKEIHKKNAKKYKENFKENIKQYKNNASNLAKMYYTLLNYLKLKNSDIDYLGEYRYQYQKHRMIAKKRWYLQIWDRISWGICGFGEKTGRFAIWFVSNIIFFAICYMFSGLQIGDRKIEYTLHGGNSVSIGQVIEDFGMCIHFSVVTFSTVGYGNITPLNEISTCLCTVQILVGMLFVAIFTSILVKKLIRQ
ncbi:pentapeptide repeat-containing protein [Clostridium felsineum]|uniref:ion channel n=1 Tax=Clostridium felsineum TaxID=36839 RepID=UPI00214DB30A|nr:pentapeptide repeat-containing protein [Clostridium felsineum]MCR3758154.1 pentapeptide repeat-containing protein [Clostridium felsineum]